MSTPRPTRDPRLPATRDHRRPAAPGRFIPRPGLLLPVDPPHVDPPADPPKVDPPEPAKTFTQAEVNALAAREKSQGSAGALREVAETLGCTVEEAKAIIDAKRTADTAALSEAERREAAAVAAETAAKTRESAADLRAHALNVERLLLRSGLAVPATDPDDFIAAAVGLIRADVGADEAALKAAVDKLKTTLPAMFGTPGAPGTPPSDPGAPPRNPATPGAFGNKGLAEAQRRGYVDEHGKPVKQTA